MFADEVPTPPRAKRQRQNTLSDDDGDFDMRDHAVSRRLQYPRCRSFEPLSRAVLHESSIQHTARICELNQTEPLSSPPLMNDCTLPEYKDDEQDVSGLGQTADRHGPTSESGLQPGRQDGSDLFCDSEYAMGTIHGPALPEDPADQLYNDWGGNLGYLQESSEEHENSEDCAGELGTYPRRPDDAAFKEPDPTTFARHSHVVEIEDEDFIEPTSGLNSLDGSNGDMHLTDLSGGFEPEWSIDLLLGEEGVDPEDEASKLGAGKLPTIRQVKLARESVQRVVGLAPETLQSAHGNLYTVESMERIIQHEFANPPVRRLLATYAQEAGNRLQETRQARKRSHEVDANPAGPMVRSAGSVDFYVHEVAMVHMGGGPMQPVMILRWFETARGELVARVHPLRLTPECDGFVVDARPDRVAVVLLTAFVLSVEELLAEEVQVLHNIPSPSYIKGVLRSNTPTDSLEVWPHPVRNEWRIKAQGQRVHALPIWLYCDDTSGNTSKKWNKHNSIHFVLGGLPHDQVQRLYNIHFLSTSNVASPLEMMEKVSEVLRSAHENGIDVWECLTGEDALVIPWVHAFQGDNPMASEFLSHIGMTGKCICRICEVYRKVDAGTESTRAVPPATEASRLRDFLKAGEPRTKTTTLQDLREQEVRAFGGAPSAVDVMGTNTGTKDKYLQFFVADLQSKLNRWCEEKKTGQGMGSTNLTVGQGQAAGSPRSWEDRLAEKLRDARHALPENIFNPVLQIPGVVKYFWRDACLQQNAEGKAILKARLTSMTVDGLGISPIRGHTLVYYAKSLVGHDFRTVIQVASAVLHGMVPEPAYEACIRAHNTHKAQPRIISTLWNTQWFNKPKFHLFVHLIDHILCFGPAALYSTEAFESYNYIIRLRSINLNKHAPSLDIANAFSHLHAVRHLISGGFVTVDEDGERIAPRQAGPKVMLLLKDDELRGLMGMAGCFEKVTSAGLVIPMRLADGARCSHSQTSTIASEVSLPINLLQQVTRCKSVTLSNEDRVSVNGHVIYTVYDGGAAHRSDSQDPSQDDLRVGGVTEILASADDGQVVLPYRMPSCRAQSGKFQFLTIENLCASINTFHNCAVYACQLTKTRIVMQERMVTDKRDDELLHVQEPEDRVLNLARVRSSSVALTFRTDELRYPPPDMKPDDIIEQAIK
ncbi:hypothetical protein C8Q80DRAFT_1124588 [Daedaleopsis nitida]|nr:hypothetical protein C8Q80DRAFT_1124588 [Daedaleopsis nitida]